MKLQFHFSLLLEGLFLVLFLVGANVHGRPTKQAPRLATLPLKRSRLNSKGLHPLLYKQQRHHHALHRLARATGREPPSEAEMTRNMHRRVEQIKKTKRQEGGCDPMMGCPGMGAPPVAGFPPEDPPPCDPTMGCAPPGGEFPPQAPPCDPSAGCFPPGAAPPGPPFPSEGPAPCDPSMGCPPAGPPFPPGGQFPPPPCDPTAGCPPPEGPPPPGLGSDEPPTLPIPAAPTGNNIQQASAPTVSDSLGLSNVAGDLTYTATVQIGNPPRDFRIIMDTGSSDFWVGSERCQSSQGGGCGDHPFLGSSSSSTFVNTGLPWSITYGSGAAEGTIVNDDVFLAGLPIFGHMFGVADFETPDFTDPEQPVDGLMGLARSSGSTQSVLTPVDAMVSRGLIPDPIVAFKFNRIADGFNDAEITFGGLDPSRFDPSRMVVIPSVGTSDLGFWEARLDGVTIDGQDLGLQGRLAILDTGSTDILAPPADAQAFHNAIPGAKPDGEGGFLVPCGFNSLVAFNFGGQEFIVDPRDIKSDPVDFDDPTGDCFSNVTPGMAGNATEWLLGDAFLKNVYHAVNGNDNTIALTRLA